MRFYNKKQAYTLAEIMLVLLILSIIFAAFAPIFTKRKITSYSSKYNVWDYADRVSLDAYYDPGDPSFFGELFFGVTPNGKNDVSSTYAPLSKLVIRSGEVTSEALVQRQIQFRYGRPTTTDKGDFAGSWIMDGENALLGGRYRNLIPSPNDGAKYNVAIGYDVLNNITTGQNNTAVGYNALGSLTTGDKNVAVGYNAGSNITTTDSNTYAGAFAGYKRNGNGNTMIGYYAGGFSSTTSGSNNLFIGAYSGYKANGSYNTGIGYGALQGSASGQYNIALGYNALKNLTSGNYNVAIGYNACSEVTTGSYKTCIGANSGPHSGTTAEKYLSGTTNSKQVTYIGGKPYNFGGDAVLEIHNKITAGEDAAPGLLDYAQSSTPSSVTTVINGNLIVRGRPFFTVGNTLYHFHDQNTVSLGDNWVYGYTNSNSKYFKKCSANLIDQKDYTFTNCINLDTSDRRLKNITSRNTDGLAEILKLKVYNYTFKDDAEKKPHVGVIAQDLQKVFPNAVVQGSDGYLRIRWDEMFYATINAIKELDQKIVAIAKRVTNVETRIADLEKENASLKSQVDSIAMRINKLKAQ